MTVIRAADVRRSETPNAVMTTLASPTLGGARASVWRVEMTPGAAGPEHVFDAEQVWTIVAGGARFDVDGHAEELEAGDTVVLPAGATRRIVAAAPGGMAALVTAAGDARASTAADGDRGVPPWIA